MGKLPHLFTDTETDNTSSSVETLKRKKKPSILKYTSGNIRKKKCKIHSRSEPDDSDRSGRSRSQTSQRMSKLRGILKMNKDKDKEESSSEDEDDRDDLKSLNGRERCLVGRVPRPAGSRPGRGGGLAIIVKKNLKDINSVQDKPVSSSSKKRLWLPRKRSY